MLAVLATLTCPCLCTEALIEDTGTIVACVATHDWTQAWCECSPDDACLCEHIEALLLTMAGIP